MWVANFLVASDDDKLYAFALSDGTRDAAKDIDLHDDNTAPFGIWSNRTTMWVVDSAAGKLFAYKMSDGSRAAGKDITLASDNTFPAGVWSDGTTVWVVDSSINNDKLYAYALSDGSRAAGKDIDLAGSNASPWGLWSDETTMWVADHSADKVFAYLLSDGSRDADRDITLVQPPGTESTSRGVWSNGATLWVADDGTAGPKVFAYNLPRSVVPVNVTIEAKHESIGAGLEDLVFTLTREGGTTDELVATVDITQEQAWLTDSYLSHEVTFEAGDDEAKLKLSDWRFSFTPDTKGDLTATVSGSGITGGSATVEVISIADPPLTISYDMPEYTFAEDADAADHDIYVVATLDAAYPRAPTRELPPTFSTVADEAESPEDYAAVSWQTSFAQDEFERDTDTDPWVARLPLTEDGWRIKDDDEYEGRERLGLKIEESPFLPGGAVAFQKPDGTTCEPIHSDPTARCPAFEYPVYITDEEDRPDLSLSADRATIDEEDDAGTMDIAENVSTVTVGIANGTFARETTVTLTFSPADKTYYRVRPADHDSNTAGHQVILPAGDAPAPVDVTITAKANTTAHGNQTVHVDGDFGGTVFGSATITIIDDETTGAMAPGAPTDLSATADGSTTIDLGWTAPTDNGGSAITGYRIEVSSDGGANWSDLEDDTGSTGTTYAHTGLSAGDTRHYRVSARNTNGAGAASNVATATTGTTVPGDATLSALSVSPKDIIGFVAARTAYEVGVAPDVGEATVTAVANDDGASVSITSPADADSNVAGHQVTLSAGANLVRVEVTAEDGATRKVYTVSVNRGVTDDGGWQAGADLDGLIAAANTSPHGRVVGRHDGVGGQHQLRRRQAVRLQFVGRVARRRPRHHFGGQSTVIRGACGRTGRRCGWSTSSTGSCTPTICRAGRATLPATSRWTGRTLPRVACGRTRRRCGWPTTTTKSCTRMRCRTGRATPIGTSTRRGLTATRGWPACGRTGRPSGWPASSAHSAPPQSSARCSRTGCRTARATPPGTSTRWRRRAANAFRASGRTGRPCGWPTPLSTRRRCSPTTCRRSTACRCFPRTPG